MIRPKTIRAWHKGKRVWAVLLPHADRPDDVWERYTLSSGVVCSEWGDSRAEAEGIVRGHMKRLRLFEEDRRRAAYE